MDIGAPYHRLDRMPSFADFDDHLSIGAHIRRVGVEDLEHVLLFQVGTHSRTRGRGAAKRRERPLASRSVGHIPAACGRCAGRLRPCNSSTTRCHYLHAT